MAEAATTQTNEIELAEDATPVMRLARRDGAIALFAITLWAAADMWHATTGLGLAAALAAINGIVVGAILTLGAHEWGHFAGARLGGGIAPTRKITSLFPIFDFDLQRSPAASFRAMSVGGNLGHWLVVALLVLFLPLDSLGRLALVCAAFARAVSASVTEFPIIRRAYAGASAVESFAGLTGAKLRRNNWIGAAAGLALFLVL